MTISRIAFEYPDGWLEDSQDPISLLHRACYRSFARISSRLGLDLEIKKSLPLADFAPRYTDENTLLVSMHSVGIFPNVARLKEAYLPGYYYLDRTGFSGWAEIAFNETLQQQSISSYPPDEAGSFVAKLRARLIGENTSKYSQSADDISVERAKWGEFIFLPLQVVDDVVAHLADFSQADLLQCVVDAGRVLGKEVVVKLHPLAKDQGLPAMLRELARHNSHLHITDASILKIVPEAYAVVTLNSGVGFESLILGTPVLCVGQSDYSFVTPHVRSLSRILPALESPKVDREKIDSFIRFFVEDYTFSVNDDASLERMLEKWLEEDHRMMRELNNADYLVEFFQKYHHQIRLDMERTPASTNG